MNSVRVRVGAIALMLLLGTVSAAPVAGNTGHAHDTPHGGMVASVAGQRLELSFDRLHGSVHLEVFDAATSGVSVLRAEPIVLRVRPDDAADRLDPEIELTLLPLPRASDLAGHASRFFANDPELTDVEAFSATLTFEQEGVSRSVRLRFAVTDDVSVYVCPMRCEGNLARNAEGVCSVCGMKLQPLEATHGDHSPRHGGDLFMAPDGWHHLEGVLWSPREFRVYLYNDFTQPIPATPLAGRSSAVIPLGGESGERLVLALDVAEGGAFLRARIPADVDTSLGIVVELQFAGRQELDRFDFSFSE